VHALGERPILRRHLGNLVEDRLKRVGLRGALLALGAQLGGALLHRGKLLGAEAVKFGLGILRGHSQAAFRRATARRDAGHLRGRLGRTTPRRFSIPDRFRARPSGGV
jgi:hypothetical protein